MQIRLTRPADCELLAYYYLLNAGHFAPWEPEREPGYYSVRQIRKRLRLQDKDQRQGSAAFFLALDDDGREILGHCSLTNILYGPMRACYMGYGVSHVYEGRGLMYTLCSHAIDYAFNHLLLNRIMANYMPVNQRSASLLNRLGFQVEGTAKRYLKINGVWEDHVLTSLLNQESV